MAGDGGCAATYQRLAGQPCTRGAAAFNSVTAWQHGDEHRSSPAVAVDLGRQFCRRLWRICGIINTTPALLLVAMSVLEALVISFIGTISSRFYQVFVDRQQSALLQLMLWSAGCYAATALFFSCKESLKDVFAWRWRARLTLHLQDAYCSNLAFYTLKGCDTPDQRLAQDLPQLTAVLADTIAVLAAVPFNIIWYSHLTYKVFGSWVPVVCACLFFLAGLLLQRLVMAPVAAAVFRQEAAEGAYRYKLMRLRAWAAEIALYRSAQVEQQHLEQQLSRVLVAQGCLVLRRAALTAVTKVLEYGGLIVNFGCLAAAVFGGAWDQEEPGQQGPSAGDIAAKVSVASFYLLTLINSFTQVLDLSDKVSSLAGSTARVSQLLEAVTGSPPPPQQQQQDHDKDQNRNQQQTKPATKLLQQQQEQSGANRKQRPQDQQQQQQDVQQRAPGQAQPQQQLRLLGAGTTPSHKRFASQAVLLQPPQLVGVRLVRPQSQPPQPPSTTQPGDQLGPLLQPCHTQMQSQGQFSGPETLDHVMQVSMHSLGSDMLLQEVRRAFPESPRLAPLLAVVTFQFCGSARQLMQQRLQQQQQQQQQHQQQQPLLLPAASAVHADGGAGAARDMPCCSPCTAAADAGESSSSSWLCSAAEMEVMLEVFLGWQQMVCDAIRSRGYWADAIDPRTGRAMHGPPGDSCYDEVIGAQVLLGYEKQELGVKDQQLLRCSLEQQGQDGQQQGQGQLQQQQGSFYLVKHPEAGTRVYPATLFTSAPLPVVRDAVRAAAGAGAAAGPADASSTGMAEQAAGTSGSSTSRSNPNSPLLPAGPRLPQLTAGSSRPLVIAARAVSLPGTLQLLSSPLGQAPAATAAAAASCFEDTLHHHQQQQQQQQQQQVQGHSLQGQQQQGQQQQHLLSCHNLSVDTPAGVSVVRSLSMNFTAGSSLLIHGPSGCGKSTLVRCLAGLWAARAGQVVVAAAGGAAGGHGVPGAVSVAVGAGCSSSSSGARVAVMFVPQRVLAAPGETLREQLAYPAAAGAWRCCCSSSSSSLQLQQGQFGSRRPPVSRCLDWQQQQQQQQQQEEEEALLPVTLAAAPAAVAATTGRQQRQWQRQGLSWWWQNWLSCGLLQKQQQQHQQQQEQLHAGAAVHNTSSSNGSLQAGHQQSCPSCRQLLSVLEQVGLCYLLPLLPAGLDSACEDWAAVLSPGELQRLTVARLLLHRPHLSVLDEATCSLPDGEAAGLYAALARAGVAVVSVGHASSLLRLHKEVLRIAGDGLGSWRLEEASAAGGGGGWEQQ